MSDANDLNTVFYRPIKNDVGGYWKASQPGEQDLTLTAHIGHGRQLSQ
jgi:hypothetical protein